MIVTNPPSKGRARGRGRLPNPDELDFANLSISNATGVSSSFGNSFTSSEASGANKAAVTLTSAIVGIGPEMKLTRGTKPVATFWQNLGGCHSSTLSANKGKRVRDEDEYFTYPSRPVNCVDKVGSTGQQIICRTNYVKMNRTRMNQLIYQYHVIFIPPVEGRHTQEELIRIHEVELGNPMFTGSTLYTWTDLGEHRSLKATVGSTGVPVLLQLKRTAMLPPTHPQMLTVYNICNRRAFVLAGYQQIGRHFFNPQARMAIPSHRIELWPGFNSAIRSHDEALLMRFDLIYKLLRTDSVLEVMYLILNNIRGEDLSTPPTHQELDRFKVLATQSLVGNSVLTRYNNKMYRVDQIMWDQRASDTFARGDGQISYAQYYEETYGLRVTDVHQPLLLTKAKKRGIKKPSNGNDDESSPVPMDLMLIPEFCIMTGLDDGMRKNRQLMKSIAEVTRSGPEKRLDRAVNHLQLLRQPATANLFGGWGLEFEADLLKVIARALPPEAIKMGGREVFADRYEADWSRQIKRLAVNVPKALDDWVLIYSAHKESLALQFATLAAEIARNVGISFKAPVRVRVPDDRNHTWVESVRDSVDQMIELKTPAKIVVTMVPNDLKERYDAIKKVTCLEIGVPNQVVNAMTFASGKNLSSIVTKIVLQMNVKMGGSLWNVHNPMKKVMVIGYDAYHDSANRRQSVGAAVFSLNDQMTRWYSQCAMHTESQQLMTNLELFMTKALRTYQDENNALPNRIIFYRDGVGDGQIPVVHEFEIPQISRAFATVASDYNPKLLFVVVNKRVNTRFFMENKATGRLENPPSGTVVDTKVTLPERYDFFMVPQACRTGAVSPVSFNILFDESGLNADQVQKFTYKMCHMYANWQGCIRVPAPCQYAHKLAFLVGQSLHQGARAELADKLYFL